MTLLESCFPSDRSCRLHFTDGNQLCGAIISADEHWLQVTRDTGDTLLVNRAHVVLISDVDQQVLLSEGKGNKPPRKAANKSGGSKQFSDDSLRALANGFLENASIAELSDHFGCTRSLIKELRMAFEANRGNVNEDDLGPVASSWVSRWQAVLSR